MLCSCIAESGQCYCATGADDVRAALRSAFAFQVSRHVLAPQLLEFAALWQPPAAKEGQGDCEFPLLPPWILFSPLCTAAAPLGEEAAEQRVLTRRSAVVTKGCACCSAFSRCFTAFEARPCAAVT